MKLNRFLLFAASFLVLEGCGGGTNTPNQGFQNQNRRRVVSVEVSPVTRGTITDEIKTYSTIQASDIVAVTPQVSNRVVSIHADIGDTVRQGQVLARILDTTIREMVQRDESSIRQARLAFNRDSTNFERQKTLFEKKLISESEFLIAQTTYETSKAALEGSIASLAQNKEQLANTEIRSPVYGVVVSRGIAVGVVAGGGTPAFQIANLTGLESRLHIPVRDWERTRVGQEVTFRLSGDTRIAARGRVSRISPQVDPVTGLGEVVVSITDRENGIYQGALTEAVIKVSTKEGVIVIPRVAMVENVQTVIEPESNTIRLNRTYSAFVVNDSTAVRRQLTLGLQMGDKIEVLAGLQEGDRLVVTGLNNLDDNSPVRISQPNAQGGPNRLVQEAAGRDTTAQRPNPPRNN